MADIRIMSVDSIDSVWVQVARDQQTFGWIHESKLLPNVVPDDPNIAIYIHLFRYPSFGILSDYSTHLGVLYHAKALEWQSTYRASAGY